MTPKEIYFIQQVGFQISDNSELLNKNHFNVVNCLQNDSSSKKLSKNEVDCLERCVEELKVDRWYLL